MAESATEDPYLNRVIDGRYRIVARLGAGGGGAVYRGEHVQIRKPVAIKVLHGAQARTEEFRKRFEREARAASKLSHPACVSVTDFGTVAAVEPRDAKGDALVGTPYLVMEYVQGETLASRLRSRRMDVTEALVVARGVLSALRHAHGLGLVHRDIKPGNIMLATGSTTGVMVKLLDFGLAKLISGDLDGGGEAVTREGLVFGTPEYMSPEQAIGAPVDARSDVYSVGVVLYEMLCGAIPFPRESPTAMMRAHITADPPSPRERNAELSPELEAVLLHALAKEVDKRTPSAEAFQAELAKCPEATGESPSLVSRLTRAARPLWQDRRVLAGGGALVALLLVLGITLALRHRKSPTVTTPSKPLASTPTTPPPSDKTPLPTGNAARAFSLVRRGHADEAIVAARAALAKNQHDGMAHAALGVAYSSKMWCSDAIDELSKALRDEPSLRGDLEITERAIGCLRHAQLRTTRFLVEDVGQPAIAPLKSAVASDPDPEVRKLAAKVLERMGSH